MKTEIYYDAIENATGKITTGFRCAPELKLQLATEATELGIKLSEHLENTLANRHTVTLEMERWKSEAKKQKEEVAIQQTEVLKLKNLNELQAKEIQQLKGQAGSNGQLLSVYTNPFLLSLFEKLKGRDDIVDASDGKQYSFKYNTAYDLLLAMIYSFKLKK